MNRVWVVTVVESPISVTRCLFAHGTAHDFLAWIAAKGRTASLRVMEQGPVRSQAEMDRAALYAEQFTKETL